VGGQGRSRARRPGMHSRAPASNATVHTKATRASALILPSEPPTMQRMLRARATAAPKSQSRNTSVREVGTGNRPFLHTFADAAAGTAKEVGIAALPLCALQHNPRRQGNTWRPTRQRGCATRGSRTLWLVAVNLLEEGLGIESAGRSRNAGNDREGDQGGYDGLHGSSPRQSAIRTTSLSPLIAVPSEGHPRQSRR
jgi:hypothetical protein